jgi:hypothetical protein
VPVICQRSESHRPSLSRKLRAPMMIQIRLTDYHRLGIFERLQGKVRPGRSLCLFTWFCGLIRIIRTLIRTIFALTRIMCTLPRITGAKRSRNGQSAHRFPLSPPHPLGRGIPTTTDATPPPHRLRRVPKSTIIRLSGARTHLRGEADRALHLELLVLGALDKVGAHLHRSTRMGHSSPMAAAERSPARPRCCVFVCAEKGEGVFLA